MGQRFKLFGRESRVFDEAYPMLEDAVLKYEEYDCEGKVHEGTHRMRRGDGPKLACRNRLCQGGGFNIGNEVDKMLAEKQSEKKIELSCLGVEGNPRSKSRKRNCDRSIEGTLTLVYKQSEAAEGRTSK